MIDPNEIEKVWKNWRKVDGKWTRYETEDYSVTERPGKYFENERFFVTKHKGLQKDRHTTIALRDNPEYAGKPLTSRYAELVDVHRTNEKTGKHESLKDKWFWF